MSGKTSIKSFSNSEELFKAISRLRVMVIGDVMIDSYLWGKVDRISPEAPVPVVLVKERDKRLGGAANVALNLQSLGATPILASVIGADQEGNELLELLGTNNLSAEGVVRSEERVTTVKHRIISGSHHMLRVDSEQDHTLSSEEFNQLYSKIETSISTIDLVIFEDYDKGVITKPLIQHVVALCKKYNIPTVVDPKKRNFMDYENVSLFKPNKKELKEGLKLDNSLAKISEVKEATALLRERINPELILITLSDQGVYTNSSDGDYHIPAHKREICDVSGAGDTVIAVAGLLYALGFPSELIASLSNLAGGIVCEQVGVVPIDKSAFKKEIEKLNLLPYVAGNPE